MLTVRDVDAARGRLQPPEEIYDCGVCERTLDASAACPTRLGFFCCEACVPRGFGYDTVEDFHVESVAKVEAFAAEVRVRGLALMKAYLAEARAEIWAVAEQVKQTQEGTPPRGAFWDARDAVRVTREVRLRCWERWVDVVAVKHAVESSP